MPSADPFVTVKFRIVPPVSRSCELFRGLLDRNILLNGECLRLIANIKRTFTLKQKKRVSKKCALMFCAAEWFRFPNSVGEYTVCVNIQWLGNVLALKNLLP